MKIRRASDEEINGTCQQGDIDATYSQLVRLFGEPEIGANAKAIVMWSIVFPCGTVATVYLWKESSVPRGMHQWSVGGHSCDATRLVTEAIEGLHLSASVREQHEPPPELRVSVPLRTRLDCDLSAACAKGDSTAVQKLIAAGANVNSRSHENDGARVPIEEAIAEGHAEVVRLLLNSGADVNAVASGGKVPLHMAATIGSENIVKLFLSNGADPTAADYYGTAADWARRIKRDEIANLIESWPDIEDHNQC